MSIVRKRIQFEVIVGTIRDKCMLLLLVIIIKFWWGTSDRFPSMKLSLGPEDLDPP